MKKWLDEEYEFEVEVTGYLRGDKPEGLCRNGEAIRSGRDLKNVGGSDKYVKDIVCPDGCVMFRLTARRIGVKNPFISKAFVNQW